MCIVFHGTGSADQRRIAVQSIWRWCNATIDLRRCMVVTVNLTLSVAIAR